MILIKQEKWRLNGNAYWSVLHWWHNEELFHLFCSACQHIFRYHYIGGKRKHPSYHGEQPGREEFPLHHWEHLPGLDAEKGCICTLKHFLVMLPNGEGYSLACFLFVEQPSSGIPDRSKITSTSCSTNLSWRSETAICSAVLPPLLIFSLPSEGHLRYIFTTAFHFPCMAFSNRTFLTCSFFLFPGTGLASILEQLKRWKIIGSCLVSTLSHTVDHLLSSYN